LLNEKMLSYGGHLSRFSLSTEDFLYF